MADTPTDTSWVSKKVEELFGIDLRSLAVFRISLGLVILWDLLVRSTALKAHYTDVGILPRSVLFEEYPRLWYFSLHALSGGELFQIVLFIVAAIIAVGLVLGFYTRAATILSWLLLLSLHVRNPAVLNSGDTLLLLLLFWSIFLPLGARFSIDSAYDRSKKILPRRILSTASLGLLLQICILYWFSVVWKSAPEWHTEGTAVYFALSLDRFATSFGHWLLNMPYGVLELVTRSTIWLELIGPILAFSPILTGPIRTAVVGTFILFHLGLGLAMTLGIFPIVCIVAWLVFLPGWFWDVALAKSGLFSKYQAHISSKHSAARLPALQSSITTNVIAILALWYIVNYNFHSLDNRLSNYDLWFERVTGIGQTINLNQTWRMFAPRPATSDGWYVIVGTLQNGEQINLFTEDKPVSWERPELISATYKNQRWRKFKGERLLEKKDVLGPHFANYLWHRWDQKYRGERPMKRIDIYQMYERNLLGRQSTPVEKRLIYRLDSSSLRVQNAR